MIKKCWIYLDRLHNFKVLKNRKKQQKFSVEKLKSASNSSKKAQRTLKALVPLIFLAHFSCENFKLSSKGNILIKKIDP